MTTIADTGLAMLGPMYLQAAELIQETGYAAFDDYEGEQGISICTALRQTAEAYIAANQPVPLDYYNLADELEARLAAVLYLTGMVTSRTSIRDLSDVVNNWERRFHGGASVDLVQAVAVLRTAAALVATVTGGA